LLVISAGSLVGAFSVLNPPSFTVLPVATPLLLLLRSNVAEPVPTRRSSLPTLTVELELRPPVPVAAISLSAGLESVSLRLLLLLLLLRSTCPRPLPLSRMFAKPMSRRIESDSLSRGSVANQATCGEVFCSPNLPQHCNSQLLFSGLSTATHTHTHTHTHTYTRAHRT
jgi:hypothetical protein